MYQSIEGGLFGATGEIWPKAPSGWQACEECGRPFYSLGEWACVPCRLRRERVAARERREPEYPEGDDHEEGLWP